MLLVAVFGTLFLLLALRVPIFVALGGATIVGVVLHPSASLIDVVRNSINGIDSLVLFAAPLFVLAGNLILAGGVSRRLIGWVDLLFGFSRLRLAYVNVFGSMFFGGISGSATADSAAIGSVLVPEMKKGGYPTPYAAGVTAASSSIGIIVPPSVPMILAGAATSVSVTKLFVGGYGPGILIAVSLALVAWIRRPRSGVKADPERFSLKRMGITTYKAFPALVFPVVIMGGILTGVFTATEAAAVAVVYSLLVAVFIYREMGWKAFFNILKESAEFAAVVFSIVATAQAFGRFLTLAKVPQQLTEFMLGFSKTPAVVIPDDDRPAPHHRHLHGDRTHRARPLPDPRADRHLSGGRDGPHPLRRDLHGRDRGWPPDPSLRGAPVRQLQDRRYPLGRSDQGGAAVYRYLDRRRADHRLLPRRSSLAPVNFFFG